MSISQLPARPKPVQLPKKLARHVNHFVAFSPKAELTLEFFGEPEFDFWALNEIDPNIVSLCSQPEPKIEGVLNGKKTKYVFDLWRLWKSGRDEYVEVKPTDFLIEDKNGKHVPKKWSIGSEWCKQFGKDCSFVTDDDIYENVALVQNAHRIASWAAFAHRYIADHQQQKVLNALKQFGQISISQLCDELTALDRSVVTGAVATMICRGDIQFTADNEVFGRQTQIEARHG